MVHFSTDSFCHLSMLPRLNSKLRMIVYHGHYHSGHNFEHEYNLGIVKVVARFVFIARNAHAEFGSRPRRCKENGVKNLR